MPWSKDGLDPIKAEPHLPTANCPLQACEVVQKCEGTILELDPSPPYGTLLPTYGVHGCSLSQCVLRGRGLQIGDPGVDGGVPSNSH